MAFVSPTCVVLGVLFPQLGAMRPLVTPLFAFMTFQSALSNTFRQPRADGCATRSRCSSRWAWPRLPCPGWPACSRRRSLAPTLTSSVASCSSTACRSRWSAPCGPTCSAATRRSRSPRSSSPRWRRRSRFRSRCTSFSARTIEVDAARMMGEMVGLHRAAALAGTLANDLTRGRAAREVSPVLSRPRPKIALRAGDLGQLYRCGPPMSATSRPRSWRWPPSSARLRRAAMRSGLLVARLLRRPYDQACLDDLPSWGCATSRPAAVIARVSTFPVR